MHPASRILTYLMAALAIPGLPFFLLSVLLVMFFFAAAGHKPWHLIRRSRWLLLVLLLGYAWSLPGEPVFAWAGAASPSIEGLVRGVEQVLRLLFILLLLDSLVLRLPTAELMAGVHALLRPLARAGVQVQRATLRLGLTLRAIEGLERGHGNLRRLASADMGSELPASIVLETRPLALRDLLLPLTLLPVLIWLNA